MDGATARVDLRKRDRICAWEVSEDGTETNGLKRGLYEHVVTTALSFS